MKNLPPKNKCEICGKPKGRYFDHTLCSKIKQKQHAKDVRRDAKKHLDENNITAILKQTGE